MPGAVARIGRLLLAALLFFPGSAFAGEILEEPIAVVGDRLILRSEWESQLTLYALQTRRDANDPGVRDTLGQAILDQMINDQLILIQAGRDTSLKNDAAEIDQALQEHIDEMRQRFGGDERFRERLMEEGLTERDLRVRYRREVENQLLKQKLVQKKLAEVAVSNGEVREFYNQFRDSLPVQPRAIKLAHILMPVVADTSAVDVARSGITRVLAEIQGGLDFSEAARRHSQDPSGSEGGDLGWFGKGDMVGPFEQAAFALEPGQISGVVRTQFGFHLIQCVERDRDRNRVHARHILIAVAPAAVDSAAVFARADSVAKVVRSGGDFCQLAQAFSKDAESQKNCGELGWYPIDQMFPEFQTALVESKTGDIVGPVSTQFGWHVLRVLDRRDERRFDLEHDWDAVKQMARQDKTNKVVSAWIEELKQDTYVSVRPLSGRLLLGGEKP